MNENKTSFEKDFSTSFEKDFSDLVDISTKYGFTKASADTLRILDADSNNVLDVTLTEKQVIIKLADDSVKSFDRNTSGVIKSYLFLHGKTMEDITELETVKKASAKKVPATQYKDRLAQKSNNRAYCYVMTADLMLAMSAEGYFGDEAKANTFTA
jgi:hypothetical protein